MSDHHNYRIEEWTRDGQYLLGCIASASNAVVARAAFDAAVKLRPTTHIILRDRTRVIAEASGG